MTAYFKGPILFHDFTSSPDNDWIAFNNLNRFKVNVKSYLNREVQSLPNTGNANESNVEWLPENFPLYQTAGLRSSARLNP